MPAPACDLDTTDVSAVLIKKLLSELLVTTLILSKDAIDTANFLRSVHLQIALELFAGNGLVADHFAEGQLSPAKISSPLGMRIKN